MAAGTRNQVKNKCLVWLKRNALLIALILSMGAGVGLGLGLRLLDPPIDKKDIMYLGFPGVLLMRMLKMLMLPFIISSMISGVAALSKTSGRVGVMALVYFLTTTIVAAILGVILVVSIQPGKRSDASDIVQEGQAQIVSIADSILDLIRNMFPDNLVTACFQQQKTKQEHMLVYPNITNTTNGAIDGPLTGKPEVVITGFSIVTSSGTNILGILVFSISFGLVLANMGHEAKPLIDFFDWLNDATMKLITVVIWYSPIGIMFLIAAKLVEVDNLGELFKMLGLYAATVMAGLGIHGLIVQPLVYLVLVRKNPFRFVYGVLEALVTALGTASSTAALPVTIRCLEENNKIDHRVTRSILPIGALINLDGTALYEAVAVIFIAQLNGVDLDVGQTFTVGVTATLASMGSAGIPQGALVIMSIVLTSVGLPQSDVVYVIAIDWLIDRFVTMINVLGNCLGAGIVYHFNETRLQRTDDDAATSESSSSKETVPPSYNYITAVEMNDGPQINEWSNSDDETTAL